MNTQARILKSRFLILACLLSLVILAKCGKESPTQPGSQVQPTSPPSPTSPPPTSSSQPVRIDISPSTANFTALGQTIQFTARVIDNNNTELTNAAVSWSSSDTAVATVTEQGLATAIGNGMTSITARSGNVSRDASASVFDVGAQLEVMITIGRKLGVNLLGWGSSLPLNEWLGVRTNTRGQVTVLDLSHGISFGVHKPIPPEVGLLTQLEELRLRGPIAGPLPQTMTRLVNLKILDLKYTTAVCVPPTSSFQAWLTGIPQKSGVSTLCTDPVRETLIALYDKTGGPDWTNNANWKTFEPVSTWYGISTDDEGQVTGISLADNNLIGSFPGELSNLASLRRLDVSMNPDLTGIVPLLLTALRLEELTLTGTGLCVPPYPAFTAWLGTIPNQRLSDCEETRVGYFALAALYQSTHGSEWTDNTNWLSDAPLNTWFGVQTNSSEEVTGLDLKRNNLVGAIPSEIGQLKNLMQLNLGLNQLTGSVPAEISELENITHLYLHANRLTGIIPSEIGQLNNVREIRLDQNQLTGSIPSEIGQLQKLTNLDFSDNRLSGVIPAGLWALRNLRALVIRGNAYSRESGNQLTGVIPPEVAQLENLQTLDLEFNRLTGIIPPEIGDLQELRYLNLSGNRFTGSIPSAIRQLQKLFHLVLAKNRILGNMPSELGQLPNLRILNLSNNQLEGTIPAEIGGLKQLIALTLNNNQLTGTIPTGLSGLAALQVLRLSFNRLSGGIPDSFGDLSSLKYLGLTGNADMSGTIPLSLISLDLDDLLLGSTMLCAPETAEYQDWLQGIPNRWVSRCDTNTIRSVAYLTQAVQSLEYPVPLVAGEDALLRVFITSESYVDANRPPVRAIFYEGSAKVHAVDIPGQETTIPTEVDEGDLSSSANARIPGWVLTSGLEMVVEVDPEGVLDPALGIAGRLPSEERMAVDVREMPPLDLTMVPFLWTENPDRLTLAMVEDLTVDSDLFRLTRHILPVGEFNLTIREPVWTSVEPAPQNSGYTFNETVAIRALDGAIGHYMGVLTGRGTGLAAAPGFVSVSTLDTTVIAHELGHNMSLYHAPCTIDTDDPFLDSDFPYPVSAVGAWGYDLRNEMLVHPDTMDVMGCGNWISDYFFTKSTGYRFYQERGTQPAAAYGPPGRSLLLWGGVSSDGELLLEPSFVVDASPSLPDLNGPYLLTGKDADGRTLFRLSFGLAEIADGSGEKAFAFIIPARADWSNRLTEITLSGPEGFSMLGGDERLDDQDAPTAALLLDSATGTVRGILRDWPEQSEMHLAARRSLPEPGLEVISCTGVPDRADWRR